MSEVVVVRCPMAEHPQFGVPRVPLKLPDKPNLAVEKERDAIVMQFLMAHAELRRQHGGPMLPDGVDPDWVLTEVPLEHADTNIEGATMALELSRTSPIVIPDPGKGHMARALGTIPALPGEVPAQAPAPGAPAPPPVLGPGELPPPAPPVPAQPSGPQPDIRPAGCGGPHCAIVNGVEAHHPETCPNAN